VSPFPTLRSSQCRRPILSILPVPLSGSACASSEAYAALGAYSHHRTHFRLTFWKLGPNRSPQEAFVTYTTGPLAVRGLASNVRGCILRIVQKRLPKCVIDVVAFHVRHR